MAQFHAGSHFICITLVCGRDGSNVDAAQKQHSAPRLWGGPWGLSLIPHPFLVFFLGQQTPAITGSYGYSQTLTVSSQACLPLVFKCRLLYSSAGCVSVRPSVRQRQAFGSLSPTGKIRVASILHGRGVALRDNRAEVIACGTRSRV